MTVEPGSPPPRFSYHRESIGFTVRLTLARILVVDDQVTSARMLSMAISTLGHEAIEAYGGEDALNIIRTERPDIVLLDFMMPGIDGLTTLRQIRSAPTNNDIPVYVLTAAQDYYLNEKSIEAGAEGCYTKPINLQTLESLIANSSLPVAP